MPWKELCTVDMRTELVRLVRRDGFSVTSAAESLGVSRKTAHKWLTRFEEGGRPALYDRSCAPHSHPNQTSCEMRQRMIAMRRTHPRWGPRKILDRLVLDGFDRADLPSASTASDIFTRAKLVKPARRRSALVAGGGVKAAATTPNDLWTVDFKGDFKLGNGDRCYPLTIQDHHSKYVLAVRVCESTASADVRRAFRLVFKSVGVPRRILSDNGVPFAAPGVTGLSSLTIDWLKQDIMVERTRRASPQDNGSHERMHRDLKADTTRPPCRTMHGQQCRMTSWFQSRNHDRPHEALDGLTPEMVYESSAREYNPSPVEWEYPGHWEVRKVRQNGMLRWRAGQVFVSAALRCECVGLEEIDDGLWRLCYRGMQIGLLNERDRRGARLQAPNPWWMTKRRHGANAIP
jgi:putative transposase